MKFRKKHHRFLSLVLTVLMVFSLLSGGLSAYAESDRQHIHTEVCVCPGGEKICGLEEAEGHTHDESCYEAADEEETGLEKASPSEAGERKLVCGKEETEGHIHTEECVCPGGELLCSEKREEEQPDIGVGGSTVEIPVSTPGNAPMKVPAKDIVDDQLEIATNTNAVMQINSIVNGSDAEYAAIQELLIHDASISFDPDTQTFVVVDINATTADNVTRLINKGLLDEQAMKTAMDWPYYMKVSINSEDVTKTKDFYIYNGETISKGSKEAYNNSTTSMQMVPSEQGKNIIILNKGESCTVAPDSRAFFWGTDHSSTNPVPNKYGYECNPAYAAPNPVASEDFTGRECSDMQNAATLVFSYEWNLYNWMEIETWFINEQEKSIDFSTSNIPADAASPVDYLIELRDDEGNISRIPVTIYEDYSDAQHFIMMEQQGVVRQYAERDSDDWWTEGGVRIPAGYDFRIRALNNDQPIGVYVGGSEQLKSPGWDEEGFREAAEDLGAGQYIVEEYFMIPKDEIRIEKVATNAPADEEFVFTATKNYPYYNCTTYEKTETVQMPLNNYPYTLYSSADNTKIGNYKTSDTGNFTLKNGQYAIFKVWKNPDDFLDYEANGSTYWEGYKKWKEKGDPMPDSSVYTFREQEIPGCVTTVEHVTKGGISTVNGTCVDNVNNSDSILFRNAFQDTSAASGSLTISKKITGTGIPDADTLFEFTVTKDTTAAVGQYSVDGGTVQTIPADGKISIKAGQSAVLTGLEPGDYTVTESSPTQENYKSTTFSVNHGAEESGLSATVTVTGASVAATGGWKTENGNLVKDADGYFTYTLTADQIDADGNITVDGNPFAAYMADAMTAYQTYSSVNAKVKFVNETGTTIRYKDYRFDTVNQFPVGASFIPSSSPNMLNTNEGANGTSAGYGWGEVWQQLYPMLIGQRTVDTTLDTTGFDGNRVRIAMTPFRCINPAVISYFDSNPGKGTLTGADRTNRADCVTLLQMNALPELIKQSFAFKNWEGQEISLPADNSRTYSDFICVFYGVHSLDELTVAQKYNVFGQGYKGSPAMPYGGQAKIPTYYKTVGGVMENWCVPYSRLNDGSLDYFKNWGFATQRIEAGKALSQGGQLFDETTEAVYAYQPDYYLMESDPEMLRMAYEYLYDRCIRFSLDTDDRPVSTAIDNSAVSNASVGGVKEYIDKTEQANANVLAAMNHGADVAEGESITLDRVKGYIEVPNAWHHFRYYDFGFQLIFQADQVQNQAAAVLFTNTYEENDQPKPPTPPVPTVNTGNLSISKTVAGNAGDTSADFHFTVKLSDSSVNGTYGDITFTDGIAVITLKHGEKKCASGLPAEVTYEVTENEADQNGYTTTAAGASGSIIKDQTTEAIFVNTKNEDQGGSGGDNNGGDNNGGNNGGNNDGGNGGHRVDHWDDDDRPSGTETTVTTGSSSQPVNLTGPESQGQSVKTAAEEEPSPVALDVLPKTGDEFRLELWLSLMGISVAGLVAFVLFKRKKDHEA